VMPAAIKAVETIDNCIGNLEKVILENDGNMIITADHGNIEMMVDSKGRPHTQHTVGLVPSILINNAKDKQLKEGSLSDLAPTILELMNIEKPQEMNGKSLIA